MIEFIQYYNDPASHVRLSMCQTCWALVASAATEDHARWHERTDTR